MTDEVPAKRKDKKQVIGEIFSEQRIATFLDFLPPAEVDPDFHILEKAYRGMKAENFATFLDLFVAQNRSLNATNADGETLLDIISRHPKSADYVASIKERLQP